MAVKEKKAAPDVRCGRVAVSLRLVARFEGRIATVRQSP